MPGGGFVMCNSSGGGFARGQNCAGELLPGVLLQRRNCGGGFVGGGMSVNRYSCNHNSNEIHKIHCAVNTDNSRSP